MLAAPVTWLVLYFFFALPLRQQPVLPGVLLFGVLLYPVLEEIVFRGAVQGFLLNYPLFRKAFLGVSVACIVASIAFAAAHLLRQPPLWAALVFIPSIVFGWARDRHGTLFSPIALHMFYNAGFILIFQTA